MIWADRRFRLGHGRAFALYVMGYTAGRGWIEYLRIDAVEANDVFGAAAERVDLDRAVPAAPSPYFVVVGRRHPGREESVFRDGHGPADRRTPPTDPPPPRGRGSDNGDET